MAYSYYTYNGDDKGKAVSLHKYHDIKACRESGIKLQGFLTSVIDGKE
jgi:hypothetical protein